MSEEDIVEIQLPVCGVCSERHNESFSCRNKEDNCPYCDKLHGYWHCDTSILLSNRSPCFETLSEAVACSVLRNMQIWDDSDSYIRASFLELGCQVYHSLYMESLDKSRYFDLTCFVNVVETKTIDGVEYKQYCYQCRNKQYIKFWCKASDVE